MEVLQILPLPPWSTLFTYKGHKGSVLTAAWSPDGYRIASGSYDNCSSMGCCYRVAFVYLLGSQDWVWSVAWSPDGKYIASGGGSYDKTVQIWDAVTKQQLDKFDAKFGINSVVWSPDGKYVASGSYDTLILIRDPFNQTTQFTLQGHTSAVKSVDWSLDGKYIASGSFDQMVRVWDASNGNLLYTLQHNNYVKSVAWSLMANILLYQLVILVVKELVNISYTSGTRIQKKYYSST